MAQQSTKFSPSLVICVGTTRSTESKQLKISLICQGINYKFQQNFQVQFFAATTLHTKLMKYWNEVPEDHYEFLKKRILEAIISYAMGPKIVLNRLCIAVSFVLNVLLQSSL